MPGFIAHAGASVTCSHAGQALPTSPSPRVLVSGQPVVALTAPWTVAGCPFVAPNGNGPCVTGQFLVGSTRVLADGQPLVLQVSTSTCAPTGTPLLVLATQTRVTAT